MSNKLKRYIVRAHVDISKYNKSEEHPSMFGVKWDDEGTLKLLSGPEDFVFLGGNTMEEVNDNVDRLKRLNPGLIKDVSIRESLIEFTDDNAK